MTAEASECNGSTKVVEFKGKGTAVELDSSETGDLKKASHDHTDIADRERIGGAFVIVNGDFDDSSDPDLDLDRSTADPAVNADQGIGEEKVEDGGLGSAKEGEVEKVELSGENGELGASVEEGKESAVEAAEQEGQDVVAESNGGEAMEEREVEVAVTETEQHDELGSAAGAEEDGKGAEVTATETDHHEEPESAEVTASDSDNHAESGSAIEGGEEEAEAVVDESDNHEEVGSAVEGEEEEAEAVADESDNHKEVGSAVKGGDKVAEDVVIVTDHHQEWGSAAAEEEQKEESLIANAEEKQEDEPEAAVKEAQCQVESGTGIQAEDTQELQTAVTKTDESEAYPVTEDVEAGSGFQAEDTQEPQTVVTETEESEAYPEVIEDAELGSGFQAEEAQELQTTVTESDETNAIHVEEKLDSEANPVVTEIAESGSGVQTEEQTATTEGHGYDSNHVEEKTDSEPNLVVTETVASEGSPVERAEVEAIVTEAVAPVETEEAKVAICDATMGSKAEVSAEIVTSRPQVDVSIDDLIQKPRPVGANDGIEVKSGLFETGQGKQISSSDDAELETKISSEADITDRNVVIDQIGVELESETGNNSTDGECIPSYIEGDHSTNKDDDEEATHEQTEGFEQVQDPSSLAIDGSKVEKHIIKRHEVFLIRVPKFNDDELQQKICVADSLVSERTQYRDTIRDDIQKKRITIDDYRRDLNVARSEERAARTAFLTKRQEMDSVQSIINTMKNATSIADIDDKIRDMVHKQQHETISLKQEKQYIHEINQLKHLREQLSSKKVPQTQIDQALDQKDQIETRFKNLKKELDSLRTALSQAEAKVLAAKKRFDGEVQLRESLQKQFDIADQLRQEAYGNLSKLRYELREKTNHFYTYRQDSATAVKCLDSRDNERLRSHCKDQVERIMELWNKNEEFRKLYMKHNMNSTLWRLKTLDGRSLGPNEEPPVIRTYADKRSSKVNLSSSKTESPVLASVVTQESLVEPLAIEQVAQSNQKAAKPKLSTKPTTTPKEAVMASISNSQETVEVEKVHKLTKEEEEEARKAEELARKEEQLARKEEERRKEKEAAESKEQLRLEQKAKAKEAEERKRRKADKALARAQYKAQKEAELKEKKKAKKEKKKAGVTDTTDWSVEGDAAPVTETIPRETSQEPEANTTTTSRRRSTRSVAVAVAVKQYDKVQPLPRPLRNRSKRKMQPWMWVALVTSILILIAFLAVNNVRLP